MPNQGHRLIPLYRQGEVIKNLLVARGVLEAHFVQRDGSLGYLVGGLGFIVGVT
jgi:hypothetical protein